MVAYATNSEKSYHEHGKLSSTAKEKRFVNVIPLPMYAHTLFGSVKNIISREIRLPDSMQADSLDCLVIFKKN